MLMVIFGAGASYDSDPSHRPGSKSDQLPEHSSRPPLADELFADRKMFAQTMAKFPKCQAIVPWLRIREKGKSVEEVLEELQADSQEHSERHRQLAAIRYYLQDMLWACQGEWQSVHRGVTNYKSLLDEINRLRKQEQSVCLVTFNYDTMLEDALPTVGIEIGGLNDYIINTSYKLIKLHGSVNWGREIDTPIKAVTGADYMKIAEEVIAKAPGIKVKNSYYLSHQHPMGKTETNALFPAIAIPVQSKLSYECPVEHQNALKEFLPHVTKILIIGWRGTETPFIEDLKRGLRQVRGLIVCGTKGEGEEIARKLRLLGIGGTEWNAYDGGFSTLVLKRDVEKFLRE